MTMKQTDGRRGRYQPYFLPHFAVDMIGNLQVYFVQKWMGNHSIITHCIFGASVFRHFLPETSRVSPSFVFLFDPGPFLSISAHFSTLSSPSELEESSEYSTSPRQAMPFCFPLWTLTIGGGHLQRKKNGRFRWYSSWSFSTTNSSIKPA